MTTATGQNVRMPSPESESSKTSGQETMPASYSATIIWPATLTSKNRCGQEGYLPSWHLKVIDLVCQEEMLTPPPSPSSNAYPFRWQSVGDHHGYAIFFWMQLEKVLSRPNQFRRSTKIWRLLGPLFLSPLYNDLEQPVLVFPHDMTKKLKFSLFNLGHKKKWLMFHTGCNLRLRDPSITQRTIEIIIIGHFLLQSNPQNLQT